MKKKTKVENKVCLLCAISANIPWLTKFLLSSPVTLGSVGLKALVPKTGMLSPGEKTMIPLNWK